MRGKRWDRVWAGQRRLVIAVGVSMLLWLVVLITLPRIADGRAGSGVVILGMLVGILFCPTMYLALRWGRVRMGILSVMMPTMAAALSGDFTVTVLVYLHAVLIRSVVSWDPSESDARGRGGEGGDDGARLCSACGYDLAGLDAGAKCPECGLADAARAGRVVLLARQQRRVAQALLALVCSVVFGVIVATAFVVGMWNAGALPAAAAIGGMVGFWCSPAIVYAFRRGRRVVTSTVILGPSIVLAMIGGASDDPFMWVLLAVAAYVATALVAGICVRQLHDRSVLSKRSSA